MLKGKRIHKTENFVQSDYALGDLTRTIVMAAASGKGHVRVTELDHDVNVVTIIGGEPGPGGTVSVTLDAERTWDLITGIAELFGGTVLEPDRARTGEAMLIDNVREVLCANEARCLDDDIDREHVLCEIIKAVSS